MMYSETRNPYLYKTHFMSSEACLMSVTRIVQNLETIITDTEEDLDNFFTTCKNLDWNN